MSSSQSLYQVHENGGRPFTVLVEDARAAAGTRVLVYKTREFLDESGIPVPYGLETYEQEPPRPDELLKSWEKVGRVWVARCPSLYADEDQSLGNTILFQLPAPEGINEYIQVGGSVFKFTTDDPITDFESPIDNNDVPYPAALSSREAFFLAEQQRLPRAAIRDIGEGYEVHRKFPREAREWIVMYENLYGSDEERRAWRLKGFQFHPDARPLQGVEEIVPPRW